MNKCKIYLIDDHKIIRDGIKSILALNQNYIVVGESSDPDDFLKQLAIIDIDMILLDISLQTKSGFDYIKPIKTIKPQCKLVIFTMHNSDQQMKKCQKEGANSYLVKDMDSSEIIKSLDYLRFNDFYFPIQQNSQPLDNPNKNYQLSPRELEVLNLMCDGMSSKEIAFKLELSARTVEAHRLNLMKKLETSNSAETVSKALKIKLIQ
jgi:DNA-binding NarL/FixJ family response regulator